MIANCQDRLYHRGRLNRILIHEGQVRNGKVTRIEINYWRPQNHFTGPCSNRTWLGNRFAPWLICGEHKRVPWIITRQCQQLANKSFGICKLQGSPQAVSLKFIS